MDWETLGKPESPPYSTLKQQKKILPCKLKYPPIPRFPSPRGMILAARVTSVLGLRVSRAMIPPWAEGPV